MRLDTTVHTSQIPFDSLGSKSRLPLAVRLAGIVAVLLAGSASVYFLVQMMTSSDSQGFFQYLFLEVAALLMLFGGVITATDWILPEAGTMRAISLIVVVQLAMFILAGLVENMILPATVISVMFTGAVGLSSLNRERGDLIVTIGIFGAIAVVLINVFPIFERIEIPVFLIITPAIIGMLVMGFVALLSMELVIASLRMKLVAVSLAVALAPITLLAVIQSTVTQNSLQQQNFDGLQLAAQQTSTIVDEFIYETINTVTSYAQLPVMARFINSNDNNRSIGVVNLQLSTTFEAIQNSPRKTYLLTAGLLDAAGRNIFDSKTDLVGLSEADQEYFTSAMASGLAYWSPVMFDEGDSYLVFSAPIRDQKYRIVGVFRIKYSGLVLQRLMEGNRGLYGYRSYPILLDENLVRLGDAQDPSLNFQPIQSLPLLVRSKLVEQGRLPADYLELELGYIPEAAQRIKDNSERKTFTYQESDTSIASAGAIQKATKAPWYILYIQRQDFLIELLQQQNQASMLLATLIASLVSLISIWVSRLMTSPITGLTRTAEKVTAGDLSAVAMVESKDEIGTLANAFNQMTRQTAALINELEDRVQARTEELSHQNLSLRYRSQQLRTVSDVARSIASTQELQTLLDLVTSMISERFDFYHVGIFLIDETGEFAVLRAANSEGGQRMLARSHRLKVGAVGIVGFVCGKGEPRIATDVGSDAVYFNNPDLPLTRSEMALPLKIGPRIIGALDVQSTAANAYSQEDIELFGILADQITIAIMNNRLYEETNKALAEIQGLHRQYLQQEWNLEITERKRHAYLYTPQGISEKEGLETSEIAQVLDSGQILIRDHNESESTLTVPVTLRGEPIGVIHLKESDTNRSWHADEVASVQAVADQIALALENVRLIDKTNRRAQRERRVLDITSKIRSTNDIQAMISIAVEELQRTMNATAAQVYLPDFAGSFDPVNNGDEPVDGRRSDFLSEISEVGSVANGSLTEDSGKNGHKDGKQKKGRSKTTGNGSDPDKVGSE